MGNVESTTHTTRFLSRRIIIPTWLLAITAIVYTHMYAKLLVNQAGWFFLTASIGTVLVGFKLGHLLSMSEQAADENAKARRDNPNPGYSHTWRLICTWPVWLIAPVLVLGSLHLALEIIAWTTL